MNLRNKYTAGTYKLSNFSLEYEEGYARILGELKIFDYIYHGNIGLLPDTIHKRQKIDVNNLSAGLLWLFTDKHDDFYNKMKNFTTKPSKKF